MSTTEAIHVLQNAMDYLREKSRYKIRGLYSHKQLWLGAGNRWRDKADRDAYYLLYRAMSDLKKNPSFSKIPKN
jgi:hypothetical protein